MLVLDIHVPNLPHVVSIEDSWRAFAELTPSFFAFALSFLVIGRFWMGHHERFRSLRHFDARLMWPNMIYLLAIAFMPFATAFALQTPRDVKRKTRGDLLETMVLWGRLRIQCFWSRVARRDVR